MTGTGDASSHCHTTDATSRYQAEELQRKAVVGIKAQLGPHHPDTLSSVNNLSLILVSQGKLEQARPER